MGKTIRARGTAVPEKSKAVDGNSVKSASHSNSGFDLKFSDVASDNEFTEF